MEYIGSMLYILRSPYFTISRRVRRQIIYDEDRETNISVILIFIRETMIERNDSVLEEW